MKMLELKFHVSPDSVSDHKLEAENTGSFKMLVDIDIGPKEERSSHIFSIMLVSNDQVEDLSGKKFIALPIFSEKCFEEIVKEIIDCANKSSDPLATLRRFFDWEYE